MRACNQNETNSGNEENATRVKNVITQEQKDVLAPGYPFNTDTINLEVNSQGKVELSRAYFKVRFPSSLFTWRDHTDGKRYVWNLSTDDFHDSTIENVEVVFNPDFDKLPHLFASWIAHRAAATHWSNTHEGNASPRLETKANHAQGVAINSLGPLTNINVGTNAWALQNGTLAVVNVGGGAWIELPWA